MNSTGCAGRDRRRRSGCARWKVRLCRIQAYAQAKSITPKAKRKFWRHGFLVARASSPVSFCFLILDRTGETPVPLRGHFQVSDAEDRALGLVAEALDFPPVREYDLLHASTAA